MRAEAGVQPVRRRPARGRGGRLRSIPGLRLGARIVLGLVAATLFVGIAFAGSSGEIARGVSIAGVDVAGLSPGEAKTRLARRASLSARRPVVFTAGAKHWPITPAKLDLRIDWAREAARAHAAGSWPLPVRGLKRLELLLVGKDIVPAADVYSPGLEFEVDRIARAVDRPAQEAAIVLENRTPIVLREHAGQKLDRAAAKRAIVGALARFETDRVPLPVVVDRPTVTAAQLRPVAAQVRTALSAPVTFHFHESSWLVTPRQLARLLVLPREGKRRLSIGGPAATAYFARLANAADRPAKDVDFHVLDSGRVKLVPSRKGRKVDVRRSESSLLAGALSTTDRTATLAVDRTAPKLTTKRARALGITGYVGGYTTYYGGDPNRIHNVELVSRLIDGRLIKPGGVFSFNQATGARTAEKGFREAPVIINGELETGLGGGVCQVSTTVFNAAFEAGLKITARTNHALYISHYPLGRDATVNYPDTDLKFVNDTGHSLLLRTYVGNYALTVRLFGTPVHRKVVSEASPLEETGPPRVKKTFDSSLYRGTKIVEDEGEPSRSVSVHRLVYDAKGHLLYDDMWYSNYLSEPTVIRVGTKPLPEEPPAEPESPKPGSGSTTTGTTATTTTGTTTTG